MSARKFKIEPLEPIEPGAISSEEHRELVARREDPPPIRYAANDPDVLDDADLARFIEWWRAQPRDERRPYLLSRAQIDGRAPIPGAGEWKRGNR